jgi:phosphoribosylformylglycinamidine cyclo-ligase
MGSNGLTSARHDVFTDLAQKYPESYNDQIPTDLVYTGRYGLTEIVPELGVTAGKMVLSPTRTYAPVVTRVLRECRSAVKGMIHCTGGGQTKILHFIDRYHIIKDNLLPIPPLFRIIQEESGTPGREMYSVFNMGHRMELYVDPAGAQEIIDIARSFNVEAQIIGRVEASEKPLLTIRRGEEEYVYDRP